MIWWILFAFGWFVAAFWIVGAYRIPRFLRTGMLLERAASIPDPKAWPKVSVVVPARDEAERNARDLRVLRVLSPERVAHSTRPPGCRVPLSLYLLALGGAHPLPERRRLAGYVLSPRGPQARILEMIHRAACRRAAAGV
jgi:hypothetical protein